MAQYSSKCKEHVANIEIYLSKYINLTIEIISFFIMHLKEAQMKPSNLLFKSLTKARKFLG